MDRIGALGDWLAKRGILPFYLFRFFTIVLKHQKIEGGTFGEKKNRKKSHNAKKNERGDPLGLFNVHSVAKRQKH